MRETSYQFGVDQLQPFLTKYGIKKDHFVCFDEIVMKTYSKEFVDGLVEFKENVAALWLAIGARSVIGRFPKKAIEKAGFWCPDMSYPLRNPLKIAKYAHGISKEASNNMLDTCLKKDIILDSNITIIEGQLIEIESIYATCEEALKAALVEIPAQKYAMIFIHDHSVPETTIFETHAQVNRPEPDMISSSQDFIKFQEWLCVPNKRKTDLCILGVDHKCR